MQNTVEILPEEIMFVINPNSGKQNSAKIVNRLRQFDEQLSYAVTQNIEAVEELFQKLDKKYKAVVIVGGDGTINGALPYFLENPNLVLAVLPNGSGNGFARDLGFDWNLEQLMASFRKGEVIDLDLLEINGELAINVSGLGIDSYVAYHFQRSKRRGLTNYVLATARAIVQFRDFEAEIRTQKGNFSGKYRMIAIANTSQFGNNAQIAPLAKPYGGNYVVALVKPFPSWKYPEFIVKLFTGKLQASKYIQYLILDEQSEISWKNTKYHLDGEPKESVDDLLVRLLVGRVKVLKR